MAGNSATNTVDVIGGTTANPTIRQIKTLGETALGGQEHEDAILGANAFIYTNDGIKFTNRTSSGTTAPIVNDGSTYYLFGGNNLSFGIETQTYGLGSVAIGRNSTTLNYGISLGRYNKAYNSSITIGKGLTNTDTTERCLLGFYNSTTINNDDKIIIGNGTDTTKHNAIVIPKYGSTADNTFKIHHDGLLSIHSKGINITWEQREPFTISGGAHLNVMPVINGGQIEIFGTHSTNYTESSVIDILQGSRASTINIGQTSTNVSINLGAEFSDSPHIGVGVKSSGGIISIGTNSSDNTQCGVMNYAKNSVLNIGSNMSNNSQIKIGNSSKLSIFTIGNASTEYATPTIYTKGYRSAGTTASLVASTRVATTNNDYLENILMDIDARLSNLEETVSAHSVQIGILASH